MMAAIKINESEEYIGKYRVHPVAAMFPMIEGSYWEDFKGSISAHGQLEPIVVKEDVLLDGRHRLKACLELDIEPLVEEYTGEMPVSRFILTKNLQRRQLTDEQRATIVANATKWRIAEQERKKKEAGKLHGKEGGRGHKKTLTTERSSGFTRDRHARSTVGQIAAEANVSERKAAQALRVVQHGEQEAEQVIAGTLPLREAHKKIQERQAAEQPAKKKRRKPRVRDAAYYAKRVFVVTNRAWKECPIGLHDELLKQLKEGLKQICQ